MLLEGKVALITGAGSGIGRATAHLFARHGARVVVVDINDVSGRDTVQHLRGTGTDAVFVRADVGNMAQVQAMVAAAVQHYGGIDIVHSNAAASIGGSATEVDEEGWDRTLAVCLKATWMIAHHAVPVMLHRGGGTIVITGSIHSIRGFSGCAAYQASKGGLLSLTRSLACDYAPTIRVNAILPGAMDAGMGGQVDESERTRIAKLCPLQRTGRPEDIAQAALYLASDMSAFVTGTSLVVDGGWTSHISTA
jgi:NAD(P)-dependent dehydrogenase (short-subunit alcohol dehydrogenase family)